jgi:hypothetical protein
MVRVEGEIGEERKEGLHHAVRGAIVIFVQWENGTFSSSICARLCKGGVSSGICRHWRALEIWRR